MKESLKKLWCKLRPGTNKTTPEFKYYGFDTTELPFTTTKDFVVLSVNLEGNPMPVYGVYNRLTGHVELIFSQLAQAVLAIQTCQQTMDRIKTGEANGYTDYSAVNNALNN